MSDSYTAHDINVIGAFALAASDTLNQAAEDAFEIEGVTAAAVIALTHVAGGRTIRSLSRSLGVHHSRAVRIGDALEQAGLAERVPSEDDRRAVLLRLTRKGVAAAARIQRARFAALENLLSDLSDVEIRQFAGVASRVLTSTTKGREHAQSICRLCDAVACGHHEGHCPVTTGADNAELRQA